MAEQRARVLVNFVDRDRQHLMAQIEVRYVLENEGTTMEAIQAAATARLALQDCLMRVLGPDESSTLATFSPEEVEEWLA